MNYFELTVKKVDGFDETKFIFKGSDMLTSALKIFVMAKNAAEIEFTIRIVEDNEDER